MRQFVIAFGAALLAPALAGAQPAPPPTGSFVGPAIYVTDLDRSIAFYRDLIGMTVRLKFGTAPKQDVMVGFGSNPTQPSILLISDKTATPARKVEHGHGYDRLVLFMPDLPGLAARLRAAGYAPSDIKDAHGTNLVMFVSDPDGYRIELIGAKPRG